MLMITMMLHIHFAYSHPDLLQDENADDNNDVMLNIVLSVILICYRMTMLMTSMMRQQMLAQPLHLRLRTLRRKQTRVSKIFEDNSSPSVDQ
jgi:hypothetical protein